MVILGKKVINSILERLDKLEKVFDEISAALNSNNQSAETKIKEIESKLETLSGTVGNLIEEGGALTPQQILKEYFYGKQEDNNE